MRNQVAGSEELVSCGNVVSGFIPKVRKAQQVRVKQKHRAENQSEYLQIAHLWAGSSRKLSHLWRDRG
jgi:hypothetical protein